MNRVIVLMAMGLVAWSPLVADQIDWTQISRDNEWVFTESVVFADTHDPSVIKLEDGRRLSVLYDGSSKWEVAAGWPKGTHLTLAYSRARGCVLIEPGSGFLVPVYDGFDEKHPLDLLLRRDLAVNLSTQGMREAYEASIARWTHEIRRIHEFFQNTTLLPPEAKSALRLEQQAWEAFLAAHGRAVSELFSLPDGTMWGPRNLEHYHNVVRDQAIRLLHLTDPLSVVDIQRWG